MTNYGNKLYYEINRNLKDDVVNYNTFRKTKLELSQTNKLKTFQETHLW